MPTSKAYVFFIYVAMIIGSISCNVKDEKPINKTQYLQPIMGKVEAESYVDSSSGVNIQTIQHSFIKTDDEGWVAFDINIPVAGRYQLILRASNDEDNDIICWLEDYIDHSENLIYNISGDVIIHAQMNSFENYTKEGIPLNKGQHKMRLHFNGPIELDFIEFKLLQEHQETSHLLVQKTNGDNWIKVWSDEFDGESIDQNKWNFDFGNWGWGNREMQNYTINHPENARLENGHLIIEAKINHENRTWTSARITTREITSFLYGKYEIRAMLPSNKESWAGLWLLGNEYIDEGSWPNCGAINIIESFGNEINPDSGNGIARSSINCKAFSSKMGNPIHASLEVEKMNTQFHIYTIEWTKQKISFFIDDQKYWDYQSENKRPWPFSKPHHLIFNLAIKRDYRDYNHLDNNVKPSKMIVDYVRVYQKR